MPLKGDYAPSTVRLGPQAGRGLRSVRRDEAATLNGKPIIVLTSVGARTGKLRKTALMRVEHDGEYAVVASLGGSAKNPTWYHNLKANPHVELQDGATTLDYRARRGHRRGEGHVVEAGGRGLARLRELPEEDEAADPGVRAQADPGGAVV